MSATTERFLVAEENNRQMKIEHAAEVEAHTKRVAGLIERNGALQKEIAILREKLALFDAPIIAGVKRPRWLPENYNPRAPLQRYLLIADTDKLNGQERALREDIIEQLI